jgi:hypothetical protein
VRIAAWAQVLRFLGEMNRGSRSNLSFSCPYEDCEAVLERRSFPLRSPRGRRIVRKGRFYRREDSRWIARFYCRGCGRSFSSARFSPCFRQKKRTKNQLVKKLLCSGVSQRRIARLLKLNPKTVVRKLIFLAVLAKEERIEFLESLSHQAPLLSEFQFDEMESFERSKCLPLSIPLAVVPSSRKILSFRVGSMPAKGPLASISLKKYGLRIDQRPEMAASLLAEIRPLVSPRAKVTTDQNPKYPAWLRPHFPAITHVAVKGRRGCIVGQGELKKIGFDPLFSLNHTCAMIRANINRLFRRTWCTTKRPDRLLAHLELYVQYHNSVLT